MQKQKDEVGTSTACDHKVNVWLIVVCLILIIIVAASSFYLGKVLGEKNSEQCDLQQEKIDLSEIKEQLNEIQDELVVVRFDTTSFEPSASWTTFEHTGWNYKISYPDNLFIKESPQGDLFPGDTSRCPMCGNGAQTLLISDYKNMGIQDIMGYERIHIDISTSPKEKEATLYEVLSEMMDSEPREIIINGIKAYTFSVSDQYTDLWLVPEEDSEWYYHISLINYIDVNEYSNNYEVMRNIVQTFEFVN